MSVIDLAKLETREPRRPRVRLVILLTIAVLAGFIVLVAVVRNDQALGQLRIRQDGVSVNAHRTGFVRGEEGQGLEALDAVRTDETGEAQIDFFDGSLARLDVDTSLAVRELADAGGRQIALELESGRTWNRVEPTTSQNAKYEVRGPNATARVHGTTFIADGRQAPIWYYLGQLGETEIDPPFGDPFVIGAGDCVRVDSDGLRECSDHERRDLIDDWVRENEALDEAAIQAGDAPTVSPSTEPPIIGRSSGSGGGAGGGSAGDPGTSGTPRDRSSATDRPDEPEEEEQKPQRTAPPTLPPRDDAPDDQVEPPPPETDEDQDEDQDEDATATPPDIEGAPEDSEE